jgi:hypothetical protein
LKQKIKKTKKQKAKQKSEEKKKRIGEKLYKLLSNVLALVELLKLVGLDVTGRDHTTKTSNLLLGPGWVLDELLHVDWVETSKLGVGMFFVFLYKLLGSSLGSVLVFGALKVSSGDIKCSDTASNFSVTASNSALRTGLGIDKLDKVFWGTATSVLFTILGVLTEPHKSWETSNTEWLSSSAETISIDLGDNDIIITFEGRANLLVLWSETLAVSTPWGIELNKDILFSIHDNGVEVAISQSHNIRWLDSDAYTSTSLEVYVVDEILKSAATYKTHTHSSEYTEKNHVSLAIKRERETKRKKEKKKKKKKNVCPWFP